MQTAGVQKKKNKNDAMKQRWFEQFAENIENQKMPWQKPWKSSSKPMKGMPHNISSGKNYRGSNIMSTLLYKSSNGFEDMRFGTRKQLIDAGYSIRGLKNGTGCPIVFLNQVKKTEKDKNGDEVERFIWISRWYEVWNVEACENYDDMPQEETEGDEEGPSNSEMIDMYNIYCQNAGVRQRRGGDGAYYNQMRDRIVLPNSEDFDGEIYESMVAFHEAAHSTGHESRLDRLDKTPFGSPEYAFEELVAEFTALLVTLSLGGEFKPMKHHDNSAVYIQGWLKACRDNDKKLTRAFSQAQAACDYILENCRAT